MNKFAPILLLVFGVLLAWLALTGNLAAFLAAVFTPEKVVASSGR